MKRYEEEFLKTGREKTVEGETIEAGGRGKVADLAVPILVLIVLCVGAMLYTGGILEGKGVVEAFSGCDSALSLVLGSFLLWCLSLPSIWPGGCSPLKISAAHSLPASGL